MTASSGRRAQAIVDAIREGLDKKGIQIRAQEGGEDSSWMLLDLLDIVVHIFNSQSREFYNLEKLWVDAPVMKFPSKKNALCPVRRLSKSASSKGARRRIESS
ncbi:MAG: ribosome silencing factor [Omnitrophica WOR_2 bacterium RIFCSPHIGHO2_02_FULL_45_21]|nr:MAG: ribosome silencing factor [Omnitrophica WOR_2 bacterium RIFCSPHIGHO2_02_FULL_45_21]